MSNPMKCSTVRACGGTSYSLRLDPATLQALEFLSAYYGQHGLAVTKSVLMRRAVAALVQHVDALVIEERTEGATVCVRVERYAVCNAAKGQQMAYPKYITAELEETEIFPTSAELKERAKPPSLIDQLRTKLAPWE